MRVIQCSCSVQQQRAVAIKNAQKQWEDTQRHLREKLETKYRLGRQPLWDLYTLDAEPDHV